MTRPIRIAVNMQPATDGAGEKTWKAALPLGVLFEKSLDTAEVEQARLELESKYHALVFALRVLRPQLKAANVQRKWEFGNLIVNFENETSDTLLFVDRLSDDLARDVDYSKTMIDLCRRFRRKVTDAHMLDPQISFSAYHRSGFNPVRAAVYHQK